MENIKIMKIFNYLRSVDMAKQKVWTSIDEIFSTLNKNECNYIVMRNFECFEQGQVFVNGHDDIDLLCDDIKKVKNILDVRRRFKFPTVNSYCIKFNTLIVHVDIRFIGDGYYDRKWQENMLKGKKLFHDKIYIPNAENYFYSLIYHAIFQKNFLSKEYLNKLSNMASALGLSCDTEHELIKELLKYMHQNNYKATITKDPAIILNFKELGDIEILGNTFWILKRRILDMLKKIKYVRNKYV